MSILFLLLVMGAVWLDASMLTEELLYFWALFSIADALWVKVLFGGKE